MAVALRPDPLWELAQVRVDLLAVAAQDVAGPRERMAASSGAIAQVAVFLGQSRPRRRSDQDS